MAGYDLTASQKPPFGRIKIIDQGAFALLVDSTGYIEPTSYKSAVQKLKELGFVRESKGIHDGQKYETWRLPEENQTQLEDIET